MNHFTFMFTSILFHVSTILEIILINDMWIFAFLLHPYILQSTPGNSTLFNLNLLLTQFPSDYHFPHNFTLHNLTPNNANFFLFPLKVRIIGRRLYLRKGRGGRGLFYLGVAAYCGRGCVLNMGTYQTCMV